MSRRPSGSIAGPYNIPGANQKFGVYGAQEAAELSSLGLYAGTTQPVEYLNYADATVANIKLTDGNWIPYPTWTAANAVNGTFVINGTNFQQGTSVYVAGIPALSTSWINGTQLGVVLGAGYNLGTASRNISLFGPNGEGLTLANIANLQTWPAWTTASNLGLQQVNSAFTKTLLATGSSSISYALASGNTAPAGTTYNTTTGAFSGTISTIGAYSFSVVATDFNFRANTFTYSITLQNQPPGWVTASPLTSAYENIYYNQQLSATANNGSVLYTVSAGNTLPGNITLFSNGLIAGANAVPSTYSFYVNATTSDNIVKAKQFSVTVINTVPVWTTVSGALPTIYQDIYFTQQLQATDAYDTPTYALAAGNTLPSNTAISTTGLFSGAAQNNGSFTFYVVATSPGAGLSNTISFSDTVDKNTPTFVTASPLTVAYLNIAFSKSISATASSGTTYMTVSAGNSLPSGTSVATDGTFSGTVTSVGTHSFYLNATSGQTQHGTTANKQYSITIDPNYPVWVTTSPLTAYYAGQPISTTTLSATAPSGATVTYAVSSGNSLPTGATLVSGSYSGNIVTAGTYTFYLDATSATSLTTTNKQFTQVINVNAPTWVTASPLTAYYAGQPISTTTLSATAPYGSVTYAVSSGNSLPTGATLVSGSYSGNIVTAGTYTFYLDATATASNTVTNKQFTQVINVNAPTWVTASPLTVVYANVSFSQAVSATTPYGSVTYAVAAGNSLPTGLSLSSGGTLSGTVSGVNAGSYSFYLNATATASNTVTNKQFTQTVNANAPVWVTAATLPSGAQNQAYSTTVSATAPNGGTVTYAASAGNTLPSGLSISSSGVLSGTPSGSGTLTFYLDAISTTTSGTGTKTAKQFSVTLALTYTATYVLVSGGGGAGGAGVAFVGAGAGGGGGGGVVPGTATLLQGVPYTITVGAGGAGTNGLAPANPAPGPGGTGSQSGLIGSPTTVPTNIFVNGGVGGLASTATNPPGPSASTFPNVGGAGGANGNQTPNPGGAGGPAFFEAASSPTNITSGGGGGGGGGAGAVGTTGSAGSQGSNGGGRDGANGGAGATVTIYGTPRVYGGGGGGGGAFLHTIGPPTAYAVGPIIQGAGGTGGGGSSTGTNPVGPGLLQAPATAGGVNLGGGGGAGGTVASTPTLASGENGYYGGSGVVILSVPTPNYTATYTGSNVVVETPSNAPGQTIMTFNSSGTYTA